MLSRIAESLFWIGRYIERSEGTARMVDVHLQGLLQDPWADEDNACRTLLGVLGAEVPDEVLGREILISRLVTSRTEPSSIAFILGAARENARRAREIISAEFWEALNTTNARMPHTLTEDKVHPLFGWVRQRAILAVGIADMSMRHDSGWHFLALGRAMEQADMTARLLASRRWGSPDGDGQGPSWVSMLRACGGYEAFLRSCRGVISEQAAATFLVRDRHFTGSVLFSLNDALAALQALDPDRGDGFTPGGASAELGKIRSELIYVSDEELAAKLPSWMRYVQSSVVAAADATRHRYFASYEQPSWTGSAS
ncbi:alpha-E domain-containing protein [Galactobacter caseinivorans]|uniref:Alpha-E domain-containing protein n=1 Tax=Galactobacter caseinivorans TaxID=2676123 RepID=A0A496PLG7_9MICC|nr:alpha-E domain-containing protein [Galactobacter caseinivorans]RKW71378.1 alpha-E domain-containing protein [Galactobacter caseinivorans]